MSNPLVFMYSGQGSQFYHMGRELYENNSYFRKWMLKLDAIACDFAGTSIVKHIYDNTRKKSDPFDEITYSNPAIFMVEYSLTRLLLEKGIQPDYLLGASLGEYICAAVAGIAPVEDIFEVIIKLVKTFKDLCPQGGMIAVLHDINLYYDDSYISQRSELAGINFSSHFILSGSKNNLADIENYLRKKNIIFFVLPILFGFHSNCIDPARKSIIDSLNQKILKEPSIPIFSCSQIKKLKTFDAEYFWEILRKPIMFQQTIINMENSGNFNYLDLSPSGTLATFIKYNMINSQSKSLFIFNPFGNDIKQLDIVCDSFKEKNLTT